MGQVAVHCTEHGTGRPVLVPHGAGRLDSMVGHAAAAGFAARCAHATLAVVDDAGHTLPHEQPDLLRALLAEWLERVRRPR